MEVLSLSKVKERVIVFGEIYEIERWYHILKKDYPLKKCMEDIMYYAYLKYGDDCFRKVRGAYSCLLQLKDEIRIYVPPFQLVPLYYTKKDHEVYVSDSFFDLAKARNEKLIVNRKSLLELFSFSPCMSQHQSVYKHMYALASGHVLIYTKNELRIEKWYHIPVYDHKDSYEESVQKIRKLLKESIEAQKEGVEASCLSGGLDSSIIVSNCENIQTYSLDYEGNQEHFQANRFQQSLDTPYIEEMCQKYDCDHHSYMISQEELVDCLKDALWAREVPGMVDIDASLYWFVKQIKKNHSIIFSGECADEVFGGYPWFHQKEYENCESFPFLAYQKERLLLLRQEYRNLPFDAYMKDKYDQCLKDIVWKENKDEQRFQKMRHLTFDYFMQALIVRQYCMSKVHGVKIRVPFADVSLMEYVYNLPVAYCHYGGKEKQILRDAFKDVLPSSIYHRKKNPFPKSYHPLFTELVCERLKDCLKEDSVLLEIFDKEALEALIASKGQSYTFPWFGQLMSGPSLLAYIYTFHVWLSDERIQLDLSC